MCTFRTYDGGWRSGVLDGENSKFDGARGLSKGVEVMLLNLPVRFLLVNGEKVALCGFMIGDFTEHLYHCEHYNFGNVRTDQSRNNSTS